MHDFTANMLLKVLALKPQIKRNQFSRHFLKPNSSKQWFCGSLPRCKIEPELRADRGLDHLGCIVHNMMIFTLCNVYSPICIMLCTLSTVSSATYDLLCTMCFLAVHWASWTLNSVSFIVFYALYQYMHRPLCCTVQSAPCLDHLCSDRCRGKYAAVSSGCRSNCNLSLSDLCLFVWQRWQSARTHRASSSSPSGQTSLVTASTSMRKRRARVRKIFFSWWPFSSLGNNGWNEEWQ